MLTLASPLYAAAPKAGTTCTKKNVTATSGGKLYTCILSGNKLVWNSGVILRNASTSNTPIPSTKNTLAGDSRITSAVNITNLETCKTTDKTPEYQEPTPFFKNGFPRPESALTGKKSAKILVIPMLFKDLPFYSEKIQRGQLNLSDLDILNEVIPRIQSAYKKLSLGRFEIRIDVLPKSEWWTFDSDQPFSDQWGSNNFPIVFDLIGKEKSSFKFDGYDAFVFLTGSGNAGLQASSSAQAAFSIPNKGSATGLMNGVFIFGRFNQEGIWVHELGHALYGLEDLYLFSDPGNQKSKSIDAPYLWDIMGNANRIELLEWNRFLMGWLKDTEVRCLSDQKSTIHYLSDFAANSDPKLLTINLAPGATLAAEVRNYGSPEKGLLLYSINTYVEHGQGPVQTHSTLVKKGQKRSMLGWEFSVLDSDEAGVLFSVTKTDIDNFVPPKVDPVASKPSGTNPTLRPIRGDIVQVGYLKGLATWEINGHESYRLYVTAGDDFQKVYFETGVVNDSRNPLKIEITGLVCNKDLRTVTEFYSKKNGGGERFVIESKQLTMLPCEDSSKKP